MPDCARTCTRLIMMVKFTSAFFLAKFWKTSPRTSVVDNRPR